MKHILRLCCLGIFFLYTSNTYAKQICLFSPEDKPTKKLIEIIKSARISIHAAMYLLTDKTIAEALVAAKKERSLDIKIVLDQFTVDSKYGKSELLHKNGIDVFVFNPETTKTINNDGATDKGWGNAIMHNKFIIVDGTLVWTGSFNWTVAANTKNCENVLTTDDREICKQYEHYFHNLMTTHCTRYHPNIAKNNSRTTLWHSVWNALESTNNDSALFEKLNELIQQHKLVAS
jgi:phosphatidylserine/phosphatidylglycerophosphate/cardiolipin synthase-like enzyme